MNILVVTTDFPPLCGGISRLAYHVVCHLARQGHQVRVIAPAQSGGVRGAAWTEVRTSGYNWGMLRGIPMFLALLREPRSDMVIAMNVGYGALMAWTLRLFGRSMPYAVFAYGYEFARHEHHAWMRALYGHVFAAAARVFTVSRPMRERLLRFAPLPPDRVEVIWPGVDSDRFSAAPGPNPLRQRFGLAGRRVIVSLARLVPRKGHDMVLRALPQVIRRVPDLAYVVAGDGPQREALQALARDLGVADRVHWAGELAEDEVPAAFHAADVFVLPCRELPGNVEGFGIVFLEAGAAGKPVVAGDSGGVRDAVIDGQTGRLVDAASKDAVAAALIELLTEEASAVRMGAAGRLRARAEFSWSNVLAPLDRFLTQVENGRTHWKGS